MWVLFFALISMGMGQTVVFAVLPLIGRELSYSEIQINVLVSSAALMYFLASPRWGRFSQRVGRKRVIVIGLLGYTFGTMLFNGLAYAGLLGMFAGTGLFVALVLSRAALTAVMAATQPGAMAYMADNTSPAERTRGMSKMSAASGIGTMMGPGLTWFATYSLLAPLYIQATFTFIAALLVLRFLPDLRTSHTLVTQQAGDQKNTDAPVPASVPASVPAPVPAPVPVPATTHLSYFDPRFRIFLLVGFMMYTMMGVVQQTLAYYYQDLLGLDSAAVARVFGTAMMVSSGMMLFSQLVIVQRWGWQPRRLLCIGLPLAMVGYAVLGFSDQLWHLVLAMGFFGLGMGLAGPGFSAGSTLQVKAHEQGALAGLITSAPGLGFVIGPLLGAFMYTIDIRAPYWLASAVFVPLVLYVWYMSLPGRALALNQGA
jgi:MFS family permease